MVVYSVVRVVVVAIRRARVVRIVVPRPATQVTGLSQVRLSVPGISIARSFQVAMFYFSYLTGSATTAPGEQ